ncbi:MAG: 16S rRNA (uracil(1498)-N(3))-methyltransferase [Pseudomonadota bacterium]
MTAPRIRLFVDHSLCRAQCVPLDRDQAHYLFGVMRQTTGGAILVFNGRDGEWRARITTAGKRSGLLEIEEQTRPQHDPPDLWLLFAPIKKTRTDFIVEKATELGAARILPVQTEFTNSERLRQDRLQAHAIEAAEQCGGTYVPEVAALQKLDVLLSSWPEDRSLMFCDEAQAGKTTPLTRDRSVAPWAILIGPEGGFSKAERDRLTTLGSTRVTSLGPRILRADTAAVAAMTLWQDAMGDWR